LGHLRGRRVPALLTVRTAPSIGLWVVMGMPRKHACLKFLHAGGGFF
jgi:hypothetical protein